MMKILIVSQFYYPERFTISEIASSLVKFGHEVAVITGKPNYCFGRILPEYQHVDDEIIEGVKVHRVDLFPRQDSRLSIYRNYLSFHHNAKAYARKLKEEYDVVLSVSLSPVISIAPAVLYAKKHHVKHVLHCLDLWPESTVVTGAVKKNSLVYRLLYLWSKSLYSHCDKILVSSPSFIDYFRDVIKLKNKPFAYVPQPALISHATLAPIAYQKKYNFVYVGNIGRLQLIEQIARAGEMLRAHRDIEIHLIGMGSESAHLRSYITERRLEGLVTYHGPLPLEEAERYYRGADALLVTLKNEGTVGKTIPNKLIHYLRYGRVIIGALHGDGRAILSAAGGAVLVAETSADIASAIEDVIAMSALEKAELGEMNRAYYQANFELEKIAHTIEKELLDVVKK